MAIGRTNAGGGGGSGATLTITGVAGATVTASRDGKTYTRTISSSGTAVFKGLSTGTWTVTMSGNGQTTTRTVEITADYSLAIAFFSATISITYPAASTCVVTDSTGATVASDTNADSAAKTWTATVGAVGAYTITATSTSGGKTKSSTVTITAAGQATSVTLAYELILFDGTDNTDVTGGLKLQVGKISEGGSVVSVPISGGKIKYNKIGYIGIYPTKKADISPYSTLYVDLDLAGTILQETHVAGVIKSNLTPAQAIDSESTSSFLAYKALEEGKNSLAIPVDNLSGDRQFLLTYYTPYSEEVSISNIRFV